MAHLPRPKILVFAGSIRSGSLSQKLANAAAKELALNDADVTKISLADYPLPIYDGDLEKEKGVPENGVKLARLIAAHQGVFIATPEYNNSLPPLLKNAIDWVSRIRESSGIKYRYRVYGVGSTSDGRYGGARALIDLRRAISTGLRAVIVPDKIEVSYADRAFNESGDLADEAYERLLKAVVTHLIDFARRLAD
ncbi:MAG TPA: NAD(P)H-dependent oxidoreductase [Bauldia sp.]|nr:NAD(P)H-dependent oxidoreductase [Bauldia sp.]